MHISRFSNQKQNYIAYGPSFDNVRWICMADISRLHRIYTCLPVHVKCTAEQQTKISKTNSRGTMSTVFFRLLCPSCSLHVLVVRLYRPRLQLSQLALQHKVILLWLYRLRCYQRHRNVCFWSFAVYEWSVGDHSVLKLMMSVNKNWFA